MKTLDEIFLRGPYTSAETDSFNSEEFGNSRVLTDHSSGYTIFTSIKKFFFCLRALEDKHLNKPSLLRKCIFKTPVPLQSYHMKTHQKSCWKARATEPAKSE